MARGRESITGKTNAQTYQIMETETAITYPVDLSPTCESTAKKANLRRTGDKIVELERAETETFQKG